MKLIWIAPILAGALVLGYQPADATFLLTLGTGSTCISGHPEPNGMVSENRAATATAADYGISEEETYGEDPIDASGLVITHGYTRPGGSMTISLAGTSESRPLDTDVSTANASDPEGAETSDGASPPLPEPTTMLLLGLGLVGSGGFGIIRSRRRK